mgnify:CR=1 FL=1
MNWFLRFLEDRMRATPPDWWRDIVRGEHGVRRYDTVTGEPIAGPYHAVLQGRVKCPVGASAEYRGEAIVYRSGDDEISIPSAILDDADFWSGISGCFTDRFCLLALHTGPGFPHDVVCIDRSTEELVWRSTACGCCFFGFGKHVSWVSIVVADDGRVCVFGAASMGCYAHTFRAADGESLFHFSHRN